MSCIDAAIIAEMNKQKTSNANSITTNSVNCNGDLTVGGKLRGNGGISTNSLSTGSMEIGQVQMYWNENGKAISVSNKATESYSSIGGGSQTITHHTNVSGEIGTFCEATGEIYDGYDKIDNTDCICKVRSASALSSNVVGIITRDNEFASHGDALVKVVPGSYNIGDVLAPAENGYGRKATNEELQFMMLNSIPMVKITSINTGIANTVATFIR